LLNLFSGECEYGEQLDHYLYYDLRHQRGNRDRSVDFEAFEETSEALKQVYERVVARADTRCCLMFPVVGKMKGEEYNRIRTVRRMFTLTKIALAGGNGT
jgi:hypothetical protein